MQLNCEQILDAGSWMLVKDSVFGVGEIDNDSFFVLSSIEQLATGIASLMQRN